MFDLLNFTIKTFSKTRAYMVHFANDYIYFCSLNSIFKLINNIFYYNNNY